MRQWVRSHLTYANVMVTILAFVVLGGGTALAAFVVSSNSQIGPGTVSGHTPPSGKHSNLIAGSVSGQDVADNSLGGADINESSLTGDVRRLNYNAAATGGAPITKIATVGPFTIEGRCRLDVNNEVVFNLDVRGAAGTADSMGILTESDISDGRAESNGVLLSANTDNRLFYVIDTTGEYERGAGTSMLRAGSTTVQVDFNAVADDRASSQSCFIYGTATRAT